MSLIAHQVTLIGCGMIGGSWVRALKRAEVVDQIVGWDHNPQVLHQARQWGYINQFTEQVGEAVAGADVVILAVPVTAMPDLLVTIAPHLSSHCVVTDVGSTKGSVVNGITAKLGELPPWFVPGHPIAGREHGGIGASHADLFHQRQVILTPLWNTCPQAVATVVALWQAAGAEVNQMGVEHHDHILAATSHLPHLLAYALVDTLAQTDNHSEIFRYAAGGFRDFTRIASSEPAMWQGICLANRQQLSRVLARCIDTLQGLKTALDEDQVEPLAQCFGRAKLARDNLYQTLDKI